MSEAATAPMPPAAPAPQAKRGLGTRSYLLAGCSIGGTLCASLASNSDINFVFAIASAVFGGLIVLLTATPPAPAVAPQATAAPAGATAPAPAATAATPAAVAPAPASGSIGIGIVAGILSFIMNQIAQVAIGFSIFNIVGNLTAEEMLIVSGLMGISVVAVKVPFDLFVGAFYLSRARSILIALGVFVLTYLFCYFIEQTISATMGMSGLFNVASAYGAEALVWGLFYVIGLPLLAQGFGAFGVRLSAHLMRRAG